MRFMIFLLCILFVFIPIGAVAGCRIYHYDHDGNPNTATRMRMACTKSYDIQRIPRYKILKQSTTDFPMAEKKLRHIKLPKHKNKCIISDIYEISRMQTISKCVIR